MFGALEFREALGEERSLAISLFREVYIADVGFVPTDSMDSVAHHLVALTPNGRMVGTIRLIGAEARPFPVEDHVNLAAILSADRAVGLLDHFAIAPEFRRISKNLFLQFALLKLAFEKARVLKLTDLVIYSLPSLQRLYRSASFELTELKFVFPSFGREMSLLKMDITRLEAGDANAVNTPLLEALLKAPPPSFRL